MTGKVPRALCANAFTQTPSAILAGVASYNFIYINSSPLLAINLASIRLRGSLNYTKHTMPSLAPVLREILVGLLSGTVTRAGDRLMVIRTYNLFTAYVTLHAHILATHY
jgi:hypothetical protein